MDIVIEYLDRAIKLLKSQQIKINTDINKKNKYIVELALTHFVVNNLASLLNNKSKNLISLERVPVRFEKSFPYNFFSEYIAAIKHIKNDYKKDLERIEKNRNLAMAHLGGGKERLGYDQFTAQKIDKFFGTKSSIAAEDKFLFITSTNILEMPIINVIGKIKKILEELNWKRLNASTDTN
ncbi:hypothetical protein HY227_01035 [Candidatus Wolfebacteria bacterium]|nr:hypothetical protein [Candidatus Wolfebacteria bacterium]